MTCPACGGSHWLAEAIVRDMADGSPYRLARCRGCGLVRTVLDVDEERSTIAERHHVGDRADAATRFSPAVEQILRKLRRARASNVAALLPKSSGSVLEIGCGRGELLAELASMGFRVQGTELSESIAASARNRGIDVRCDPLHAESFSPRHFDVVVMWHVIEHLQRPDQVLQWCGRWLKADGAVVVAAPNLDSWQARVAGSGWLHLDVPRHRWHFSLSTLARLAARAGLTIDSTAHFSLEYGPFGWTDALAVRVLRDHRLFTDLLRRREGGWRARMVQIPALTLAGVVSGLSIPVEALAAWRGAGGAPVVVLRH
ncbi:MAG: class I SAM-dependent methyltransferase [Myxococcota bacterium]